MSHNPIKQFFLNARVLVKRAMGDPDELAVLNWSRIRGDETLRLDYPITTNSVVFDVGGYEGAWSAAIRKRYGCKVHVFEPMHEFCEAIRLRFAGDEEVYVHEYGLGGTEGIFEIEDRADGSSFHHRSSLARNTKKALVRRLDRKLLGELNVASITLLKLNIEGGEFDLLDEIIASGVISMIDHLQIQFHRVVPEADLRRDKIRLSLEKTHKERWCHPFVWESWDLRELPITSDNLVLAASRDQTL